MASNSQAPPDHPNRIMHPSRGDRLRRTRPNKRSINDKQISHNACHGDKRPITRCCEKRSLH